MFFHELIEPDGVDDGATLARNLTRQLDRETIRIVQQKSFLAADHVLAACEHVVDDAVEHRHAALQRAIEGLFFVAQRAGDAPDALAQLGIAGFERTDDRRNELGQKTVGIAEQPSVADGAPNQETQNEAAIGIRRVDAVVDQKRRRAHMIGDDVPPRDLLAR